jgi:SAM-dependent methyltransferase
LGTPATQASGNEAQIERHRLAEEDMSDMRQHLPHDLLELYDCFAQEARVTLQWLEPELARLPAGARVLEVGAGTMLVSMELQRRGFRVTALEPLGEGFTGGFGRLQQVVLDHADARGIRPEVLPIAAEQMSESGVYDFAFSSNVMEHVADIDRVMERVVCSLKAGAKYRFNCPNYRFPYEPHFNIPTVFTKGLTERFFGERIRASKMEDAAELWRSVNWVTVGKLRKACRKIGAKPQFNRGFFVSTLERTINDEQFASRRSPAILAVVRPLVRAKLHTLAALIPVSVQPVIDCTVTKQ